MRVILASLLLSACCFGETKIMTLRQAMDLAVQQNPDVVLARLDQQKARYQATIAGDPFSTKVFAGSGAAWTYGFPTSIDGNAPSIVQAKTQRSLYNRPARYQVRQANESARGAEFDLQFRQEEVAYQVAGLYLDAQHAAQNLTAAQRQVETLTREKQLVDARVQEGRALKIDSDTAALSVRRAQNSIKILTSQVNDAQMALALALGMNATDRVQPSDESIQFQAPVTVDEAVRKAVAESPELEKLQSNLVAKRLEISGYRAYRLPQVDLVAQYSLLAKFNNFTEFFQRFQRNNVELGASIQIPILAGKAAKAYISKAETESMAIQADITRTRGRIESDIRRAFEEVGTADDTLDLARQDLDLARSRVSLDLDQAAEGRLPQATLEQDRAAEDGKWIAFYDAQVASERARLSVLRVTGTLLEAVK